ncbi:zinc finger transcription factor 1 [Pseudomassariella vexata]|uniref:Zinc finger transcription factor 1 n=1 Tax=Pseudomassariella vexata TaxID=1141098 RepID=A0A1Y2EEP5_9PEZI|nr:zinc finger transcription factor 1 [Pseudomassariella vexata]ORY69877.1 zinc finger transcription factor 1 [Pseudomassariella vexata]
MFAASGRGSISSMGDRKDSVASCAHSASITVAGHAQEPRSVDGSDDDSQDDAHAAGNSLEDNMEDEFGLSTNGPSDGMDLGGKFKENKSDTAPAWSELKTKAGKERKRLPLACIACRRKKIRCSGEKPACKHCLRSRIPCVYKVTTRKAAPRTDYMAMLDKRLKRMEDRIIKIVPKSERDASAAHVIRAVVKPAIPGSAPAGKQAAKKRAAEEAFGADLDNWARTSSRTKFDDASKPSTLQVQEREDGKLLSDGREAMPSMEIREHLAEVFFENIYGQAYHLLHKPSYMRKLKADTLPPVLVLSVCAISARFSTHPMFPNNPNSFLRGEEWAVHARDIVMRRYEWPNITILTCFLLLGLHEFGTCHGGRSWSLGGQGIRMAFALQLHKDLEYDPMRPKSSARLSFIDREIRRRTMWACFLMDRFNSSGVDRPMFIKEDALKIQLPIKEKLFQLDMPGPTEDLNGDVPHPVPDDEGQLSSAKDNMGVAAYMIKAIALWGRIISFLNQGGKEEDSHSMWQPESQYYKLLKQAEDFAEGLPDGLKYTAENLHLHDTEGMANQFLFLHISVEQNVLFMNRFAGISPPAGVTSTDVPKAFITEAGQKSFDAANRISQLLKDAEAHSIAAPFVGYCAFLSSTVHIFGIFSGNEQVQSTSKKNLAINVKFLSKMKRHWGMFHFMSENLREQYRACADAAKQGTPASENTTASPIFQYGDWFDRYPHGVSQNDFLDPASFKKKETGDDGVLEQKPEAYTVEEFFTQLSPPQSAEGRESGPNRPPMPKRKSVARKGGGMPARGDSQHLEPLMTDLNANALPEHIQQRLQQQRNYASRLGGQTSGPASFQPSLSRVPHSQNTGAASSAYHTLSPISPVTHGGHAQYAAHHGQPAYYNPDLLSLGLQNNAAGLLPQLDRQLIFGAYGGMDPTSISGPEAIMDWDALAGNTAGGANSGDGGPGPESVHHGGFSAQPSSAWFLPFNMEPPELDHDVSGLDFAGGIFSPGAMAAPRPGMLRRGSHMHNR